MDTPISIIVPIYNTERYLHRCIDSILAQTFTDFELILVDDGSTDDCPRICDEYARRDSRVKVIHKQNEGVAAARKTGFEATRGEYIGWVDSDDWIEPKMYQILFSVVCTENVELVNCGHFREFMNGKTDRCSVDAEKITTDNMNDYLFYVSVYWNKLAKRSLYYVNNELDFPVGISRCEDLYVTFRLYHFAVNSVCVRDCLYHYVEREESISYWGNRKIKIEDQLYVIEYLLNFCIAQDAYYRYENCIHYCQLITKLSFITTEHHWDIDRWVSHFPNVQFNIGRFPVNWKVRVLVFIIDHDLTLLGYALMKASCSIKRLKYFLSHVGISLRRSF